MAFISSLLFLYHNRCHTKRTLYGYRICHLTIASIPSVPLHIFKIQVEQNPQRFRENEGKTDPILYLVGIVRCQTVLI